MVVGNEDPQSWRPLPTRPLMGAEQRLMHDGGREGSCGGFCS